MKFFTQVHKTKQKCIHTYCTYTFMFKKHVMYALTANECQIIPRHLRHPRQQSAFVCAKDQARNLWKRAVHGLLSVSHA